MNRTTKLLLLVGIFLICAAGALFQEQAELRRQSTTPSTLYSVIWKQIVAVREDDYASAYRQASTGFQERFNIEAFSDLTRTEYPSVRRARRVEFGAIRYESRHAIIPVYLFVADGDVVPCVYRLVEEDGVWKIDSVRVQRRWPSGQHMGGVRA
ncbi:MAG: DUF4864 domain-containing protein [Chthoniobacter sp.]|nr:DUF4864 domain-containing protein [Chthoniobacter sp.]